MKPERVEELARLAYETDFDLKVRHLADWSTLPDVLRKPWLRIARTLYAAAMRDAAGVAETALVSRYTNGRDIGTARRCIATTLETIAKEADSDRG